MLWAGPWLEPYDDWAAFAADVRRAADANITPLVHWWYWGNEISGHCVASGCPSQFKGADGGAVWLSQQQWHEDGRRLATALGRELAGRSVLVVVETEFNKNGAGSSEVFDGMLAEHARILRQAWSDGASAGGGHTGDSNPGDAGGAGNGEAGGAGSGEAGGAANEGDAGGTGTANGADGEPSDLQLALGFGNWDRDNWRTFDRAVGAMDYAGFQATAAVTRDPCPQQSARDCFLSADDDIDAAVRRLADLFPGRPILLDDLALSSYDDASSGAGGQADGDSGGSPAASSSAASERDQATALQSVLGRITSWRGLGLAGIVYRAVYDDPNANLQEYYGAAERHWGLRSHGGAEKPAWSVWTDAVAATRNGD